jgi:hypothetical protein
MGSDDRPITRDPVVVVSGLPRSGTSMMMRMLGAAGVPTLTDSRRGADDDNPLGYFELEAVKRTRADPSWLADAPGKAVKLIHVLLRDLPPGYRYSVVMMRRDLDEVLASQNTMLARSGKAPSVPPGALRRAYAAQLAEAERWMDTHPEFRRIDVSYNLVVADPLQEARRVAEFLGLDEGAAGRMAAAVDPSLYRNRRG